MKRLVPYSESHRGNDEVNDTEGVVGWGAAQFGDNEAFHVFTDK